MAYGIAVTKDGLNTLNESLISGRVYVDLIYYETETAGTTHTHTYTSIPGHSHLRVHQIGGGTHTYALSTNGSGQAVITLTATANPSTLSVPFTLLIVFTTRTSESGYGILTTNAAGDTVVSAVYPVPEYVGKITLSATQTANYPTGEEGFNHTVHQGTTTAGAGRERLILWCLPQTNEDIWYTCQGHISSAVTGTATVSVSILRPSGTNYYLPEGYVFALNGLTASSEPYGLRVSDASGNPTFDSGRNHMVLAAIENIVDYPTSTGTINGYNLTSLSGVDFAAGSFPQFRKEVFTTTTGKTYFGAIRLRSNLVETRLIKVDTYTGSYTAGTYSYGSTTDLTQAIVNTLLYGVSSSFTLTGRTYQYGGTAYCSYDTSLGQTNCTSESYHTARYNGGKQNSTITYSWSLPSNAGGLSISGSSTSVDVKLVKTASGATSPGTTYSCTLRCTISDGTTAVNIDRTVTHTHEQMTSGGGGDSGGGDSGDTGDAGGGSKIVCSAMNDRYGLPRRENLIWLKYSKEHLKPEHEKGYHAWCGPLVKYSFKSGEGPLKTVVRETLTWIAKTRTSDILNELAGKPRNIVHRTVRWFVEELSYQVGKRMK